MSSVSKINYLAELNVCRYAGCRFFNRMHSTSRGKRFIIDAGFVNFGRSKPGFPITKAYEKASRFRRAWDCLDRLVKSIETM
jgi:hypothetical protein